MVRGHSTAEPHGDRVRRVPRLALQGEELRGLRGLARQKHDAVLLRRQHARLGRGAERAHVHQHRHGHEEVPGEEWFVLFVITIM